MHEYKTVGLDITALDTAGRTVEGYAAVFGNLDLGADVIHPGAFTKTLAERGNRVVFLWQHDTAEPLGKLLELREDARGLFFKAVISDTARGRDALALLRDGAISGMSIGYDAIAGGVDFSKTADGLTIRNLRELRLWEISLVSLPMNEAAGVTALKEHAPAEPETAPDAAPPDPFAAAVLELRARVAALELKLQPAAESAEVDPPTAVEAGPAPEPPTAHLEAALKELELLLNIPTTYGGD